MQKYSHIIALFACILSAFFLIFLLPVNFVYEFWNIFNSKPIKVLLLPFTYNTIHGVPTDSYSSGFITYDQCFILGKLFLQ